MEKCMKFAELNETSRKIIKEQREKHVDKINEDNVFVYPQDDNETLIVEYRDLKISVRIKPPNQGTSNNIRQMLTTAGVVVAAVAVSLLCSKKKSW